jgi:hypothetical protein
MILRQTSDNHALLITQADDAENGPHAARMLRRSEIAG